MTTVKTKYKWKKVRTTLTVKLMEGKNRRDMYRDFFRGKVPEGFDEKVTKTLITLGGYERTIPYDLYKKFSGIGASREFLESFIFQYITEYKVIDSSKIVEFIYKIVPFTVTSGVQSYIVSYTVCNDRLDTSSDLSLELETHTYHDEVSADEVKRINKENARKLRHYLVSLSSVQGVPYTCTFKEDESSEMECSV